MYVEHLQRNVSPLEMQIRIALPVSVGEREVGREFCLHVRGVTFGHHNPTDMISCIDVFTGRRKEVHEPSSFILVEIARMLHVLTLRVHTVLVQFVSVL